MSNKTGHDTVTFNAYGVRDILQGNVRDDLDNIRNYGHVDDSIYNINLKNQLALQKTEEGMSPNDVLKKRALT